MVGQRAIPIAVLFLAILGSWLYPKLHRSTVALGVFRKPANTTIALSDLHVVKGTTHCEDVHYHSASNLLFTACEDNAAVRHSWFPPLANFDDASVATASQGSIKIIDPTSLKVQQLKFENFKKAFVTHGIDVIDDPDRPRGKAVYVFAVNHVPNDAFYVTGDIFATQSRSVIEVFHHKIGSDTIRHIRTIWDPLIRTPNDIFALSPTAFFVTNDHFYRDGPQRVIEDLWVGARWSNTIHVTFSATKTASESDDNDGVHATVALEGLHNNNGLGHGKTPKDVIMSSAASGVLHLVNISEETSATSSARKLHVIESIESASIVDNPSYFSDPYANQTFDASGYVTCGLSRGLDLEANLRNPYAKDPIMVWKISPSLSSASGKKVEWKQQLLFEDDGSRLRSGSAAVIVAADPAKHDGRRRGRLFATGFLSQNMIAIDIDL